MGSPASCLEVVASNSEDGLLQTFSLRVWRCGTTSFDCEWKLCEKKSAEEVFEGFQACFMESWNVLEVFHLADIEVCHYWVTIFFCFRTPWAVLWLFLPILHILLTSLENSPQLASKSSFQEVSISSFFPVLSFWAIPQGGNFSWSLFNVLFIIQKQTNNNLLQSYWFYWRRLNEREKERGSLFGK